MCGLYWSVGELMISPTLFDSVAEFLLARRADGLAESTLIWYSSLLNTFCRHISDQAVSAVTTSALRRYIVQLRESDYSADSIYAHIKAMHVFFKWAAEEYRFENPMRHISFPKQPPVKMPRRASDSDIIKLLGACGDDKQGVRDRAIIAFLTDTGCRAAGLVGLTIDNLEMDHRRAYVREKGNKTRPVFFSPQAAEFLDAWIRVRDPTLEFVFYNLHLKEPLSTNGLLQLLRRLARKAGVTGPVNPHAFRHRFGEKFMQSGGDSGVLQQMMGHSDVETTISRYGQFNDRQLASAHRKVKPLFKKPKSE